MAIFRSYDIRGVYDRDLTTGIMSNIGSAFSRISSDTIVIANDGRESSLALKHAFIKGFGGRVIDAGSVPLGVGMFHALDKHDFVYITASHMPKEWNGVKFFHKSGLGFMEDENKKVEKYFASVKPGKPGTKEEENTEKVIDTYVKHSASKVSPQKKLDVVLDCGNGMASAAAKRLFTAAGFNARAIFDKIDGSFPNHGPDPVEDELHELRRRVLTADIGVAYDGDGDRMVLVDEKGRKLTPEQTAHLILLDAVKHPGPVVANVECTRMIDDVAGKFNKKVIRVPVGHTFLMEGVQKHKACFGIEASGHYAVPYMAPFDDAIMVSLFAASVLSRQEKPLSEIVDEVKIYPFERIAVECSDEKKFDVVANLRKQFLLDYDSVNTMDGVRVDFPDGWVLIRPSNTGPMIRLTVEGNDRRSLEKLKKEFSQRLREEITSAT